MMGIEPLRLRLEAVRFALDDPERRWVLTVLRAVVWTLIVAGFVAFLLVGADRPLRPHLTDVYLPGWPHPPGASHP